MTKGKEILMLAEAIANEKNIEKDLVFAAIEQGLARSVKKYLNNTCEVEIEIEKESGDYQAYAVQTIVDDAYIESLEDCDNIDPTLHIHINELTDQHTYQVGDIIRKPLDEIPPNRISAQYARSSIIQKIKEAEHQKIAETFTQRIGEVVMGSVVQFQKGNVIVDIGDDIEAMIPKSQLLPNEIIKNNTRIRACIQSVNNDKNYCQIILSRTSKEFLISLFNIEIPEIHKGLIEINSVAREAGSRSKVIVSSMNPKIDPVGSCIGMRGSRIQVISRELDGERIDVLNCLDNPIEMILSTLAPAQVTSVTVDQEKKIIDILLSEEQLPIAIGRNGQNIRLARALSDWNINLFSPDQLEEKNRQDAQNRVEKLVKALNIDQEIAQNICDNNINSLEAIADLSITKLSQITGLPEEEAEQINEQAHTTLLQQAFQTEQDAITNLQNSLIAQGAPQNICELLIEKEIKTIQSLADLSIMELQDYISIDDDTAGKIIMCARAQQSDRST